VYDFTGARVQTLVQPPTGPVQRTWFCDEAFVINQDDSTEKYIFFNRHSTAVLRSKGVSEVIHLDGQGHPACFSTLADGTLVRQISYDPYGRIAFQTSLTPEPNRYGYGMHPDVPLTGLTHFGVRAYSPLIGRFLQPDPAVLYQPESLLGAPRSLPAYAFVMGNPITLRDPYGASIWGDIGDWFKDKVVEPVKDAVKKSVNKVWGGMKDAASWTWNALKDAASWAWGAVKWAAGAAWDVIKWMGKAIATGGTFALGVVDTVLTWINPLTWVTLGLDQIDSPITNWASFILKTARSPITSVISAGVGLIGYATGGVEKVRLKNGLLAFEWKPDANFKATTFGSTVQLWSGSADSDDFRQHETYHSYQYVGYGDNFIPSYAVGSGWGFLSAAMSGKQGHQKPWHGCGFGVSDKATYGQPMEYAAEKINNSDNCT
jgi:RHS repeat-associated protein